MSMTKEEMLAAMDVRDETCLRSVVRRLVELLPETEKAEDKYAGLWNPLEFPDNTSPYQIVANRVVLVHDNGELSSACGTVADAKSRIDSGLWVRSTYKFPNGSTTDPLAPKVEEKKAVRWWKHRDGDRFWRLLEDGRHEFKDIGGKWMAEVCGPRWHDGCVASGHHIETDANFVPLKKEPVVVKRWVWMRDGKITEHNRQIEGKGNNDLTDFRCTAGGDWNVGDFTPTSLDSWSSRNPRSPDTVFPADENWNPIRPLNGLPAGHAFRRYPDGDHTGFKMSESFWVYEDGRQRKPVTVIDLGPARLAAEGGKTTIELLSK